MTSELFPTTFPHQFSVTEAVPSFTSTITVGTAGSHRDTVTQTRYPAVAGVTAGTTKQHGTRKHLVPERSTKIHRRFRAGLSSLKRG